MGRFHVRSADVLAHFPEHVRVVWQDHQLDGAELPVHGWQRIHGEIHLLVTLPDGSRSCLPAAATALLEPHEAMIPQPSC